MKKLEIFLLLIDDTRKFCVRVPLSPFLKNLSQCQWEIAEMNLPKFLRHIMDFIVHDLGEEILYEARCNPLLSEVWNSPLLEGNLFYSALAITLDKQKTRFQVAHFQNKKILPTRNRFHFISPVVSELYYYVNWGKRKTQLAKQFTADRKHYIVVFIPYSICFFFFFILLYVKATMNYSLYESTVKKTIADRLEQRSNKINTTSSLIKRVIIMKTG